MPHSIALGDWLDLLDQEYLATFVADGGGAVKVVVGDRAQRAHLARALAERSAARDYFAVRIDAGEHRAHMPQDLFHALASRVDWRQLARQRVLKLAEGLGLAVDGVAGAGLASAIAEVSDRSTQSVLADLKREVDRQVLGDARMARDFRMAMYHLCEEECRGGDGYGCQPILDWLTGVNNRIGPLRPFSLRTPINRTTARYFLESTLYWLTVAGHTGTVLLFDASRVTLARNPRDGARYYTKAMAMDHFELLRQLIDDIDRLRATLLVVATSPDFIDDQAPRGWRIYDALRTRVMDDVRDRDHVNPVGALVRLDGAGEPS